VDAQVSPEVCMDPEEASWYATHEEQEERAGPRMKDDRGGRRRRHRLSRASPFRSRRRFADLPPPTILASLSLTRRIQQPLLAPESHASPRRADACSARPAARRHRRRSRPCRRQEIRPALSARPRRPPSTALASRARLPHQTGSRQGGALFVVADDGAGRLSQLDGLPP
jgi:hypothetical protein